MKKVLVVGGSGGGKSVLISEMVERMREAGYEVTTENIKDERASTASTDLMYMDELHYAKLASRKADRKARLKALQRQAFQRAEHEG